MKNKSNGRSQYLKIKRLIDRSNKKGCNGNPYFKFKNHCDDAFDLYKEITNPYYRYRVLVEIIMEYPENMWDFIEYNKDEDLLLKILSVFKETMTPQDYFIGAMELSDTFNYSAIQLMNEHVAFEFIKQLIEENTTLHEIFIGDYLADQNKEVCKKIYQHAKKTNQIPGILSLIKNRVASFYQNFS